MGENTKLPPVRHKLHQGQAGPNVEPPQIRTTATPVSAIPPLSSRMHDRINCERCGRSGYSTLCYDCGHYECATKLTEAQWDGPVYIPGTDEDGFYPDIDELRESFANDERELPRWVYPCETVRFALNVDRMIDDADEQLERGESNLNQLVDVAELRAFIAAWNAKQTYCAWHPESRRVIVLDTSNA